MAIWPFNRKKNGANNSKVPKEVKQYYQAEQRERMGLAWLIAFLTLVVTVLVVLGLFLGGRWVYRKATNDDKKPQSTQTTPSGSQEPAQVPKDGSGGQTGGGENNATSGSASQPTAPAPASTPNTGPGNLPNTGPDGDF